MSGRRARRCEVAKRAARVRLVVRLHTICPFVNVLVTYSLNYSTPSRICPQILANAHLCALPRTPSGLGVTPQPAIDIAPTRQDYEDEAIRSCRKQPARQKRLHQIRRSTLSSKLAIDAPGYTIPVMFSPFYRDGNALINDATFDDESTWPLYRTIVESPPDSTAMAARATFSMSHISHGQSRVPRDLQRNRAASAAPPLVTIMTTHQMAP